jgi:putative Mg2+ transporter-C (MgtC) family protein
MNIYFVHIIRLVVSCLCGIAIGLERKNRAKEAGLRTHCVVACASCLMMIISIYGFANLAGKNGIGNLDPSRIAAQIVSGIGFLGAGMIFVKRQSINGLTTAAGIWATAGIGMAIGAGMYVVGIVTTLLILVAQIILHINSSVLKMPKQRVLTISNVKKENYLEEIEKILEPYNVVISEVNVTKKDGLKTFILYVEMPPKTNEEKIISLFTYDCSLKND